MTWTIKGKNIPALYNQFDRILKIKSTNMTTTKKKSPKKAVKKTAKKSTRKVSPARQEKKDVRKAINDALDILKPIRAKHVREGSFVPLNLYNAIDDAVTALTEAKGEGSSWWHKA